MQSYVTEVTLNYYITIVTRLFIFSLVESYIINQSVKYCKMKRNRSR